MKLHFTTEALQDIEDAVIWYEEQREGLSYDFELCLEAGISEIIRNQSAFQDRYKKVKITFINRFPYGIHYIIREDTLFVLGVFHTSRSPGRWKKRRP